MPALKRGLQSLGNCAASTHRRGMSNLASLPKAATRDPWFRRRPRLAIAVIGMLYLAVFWLRLRAGSPVDAYSMLYVLPVALAATAFGQRVGASAGLLAVSLIVAWAVIRQVSLSPTAWASRVVPILLLGSLLGRAVDRVRQAERDRRRLEVAALMHREAIEINDSLIQRMVAARWSLEAGQTDVGLQILTAAVSEAELLVSGLIKRAGMGERTEVGIHTAASTADRDPG